MKTAILLTIAALTLAACGADGAPTAPAASAGTGVTFSGTAYAGIARSGD